MAAAAGDFHAPNAYTEWVQSNGNKCSGAKFLFQGGVSAEMETGVALHCIIEDVTYFYNSPRSNRESYRMARSWVF